MLKKRHYFKRENETENEKEVEHTMDQILNLAGQN